MGDVVPTKNNLVVNPHCSFPIWIPDSSSSSWLSILHGSYNTNHSFSQSAICFSIPTSNFWAALTMDTRISEHREGLITLELHDDFTILLTLQLSRPWNICSKEFHVLNLRIWEADVDKSVLVSGSCVPCTEIVSTQMKILLMYCHTCY